MLISVAGADPGSSNFHLVSFRLTPGGRLSEPSHPYTPHPICVPASGIFVDYDLALWGSRL
jgi:hypothetical protein